MTVMPEVIFPPAWVLPDLEYLLDLVAKRALFVDLNDAFDFAWVRDDEFTPARPVGVDRALATLTLIERQFLGFGDGVRLRKESGEQIDTGLLIFQSTGRLLHEYINSGR
ncbi:hypothetical protein ACWGE0_31750 [Lentzea sp. NPDC054927]